MDKSRIFIASSGKTLSLAEKLRDELQTEFCEARLWSEEGKGQTSATLSEMLKKSTIDNGTSAVRPRLLDPAYGTKSVS
jgi:hypothetical protein